MSFDKDRFLSKSELAEKIFLAYCANPELKDNSCYLLVEDAFSAAEAFFQIRQEKMEEEEEFANNPPPKDFVTDWDFDAFNKEYGQ